MMRYLLLIFFFSGNLNAQHYKQYDTITDAALAAQKLQTALTKDAANPELHCLIAQKKNLLGQFDSGIFYCNKGIQLLTKIKNDSLLAVALHIKGVAQYYLDDKLKAEANWRQALAIAVQVKDYERITKQPVTWVRYIWIRFI